MPPTQPFDLGDVLTVVTRLFVSRNGFEGPGKLLNFMAGEPIFMHQWSRVQRECRPYLIEQFPWLDSPEMQFAVAELGEMLKTPTGVNDPEHVTLGWLSQIACGKYGAHGLTLYGDSGTTIDVAPMPPHAHERIDPESEMLEKRHADNIITAILPEK